MQHFQTFVREIAKIGGGGVVAAEYNIPSTA